MDVLPHAGQQSLLAVVPVDAGPGFAGRLFYPVSSFDKGNKKKTKKEKEQKKRTKEKKKERKEHRKK